MKPSRASLASCQNWMRQQRPSSPCSGSIFLSLVADAAWKPRRVRLKRGAVDLLRGQLLGSSRFLAERWQWPEPRVRRFLDRISGRRAIDAQGVALNDAHSDALIDAQPTANGTIITIRNYDDFQKEAKSEPPSVGAKFDAQDDAPNDAPHDAKSTQREEEINNNTLLKESERTRAADFIRISRFWRLAGGFSDGFLGALASQGRKAGSAEGPRSCSPQRRFVRRADCRRQSIHPRQTPGSVMDESGHVFERGPLGRSTCERSKWAIN
jgi:hypothetical protein